MSGIDLSTYGGRLLDLGVAGQVIDLNTSGLCNYKNAGETPIDFGLFVARGPKDATCKAPDGADAAILGISVRHVTMVADAAGQVRYRPPCDGAGVGDRSHLGDLRGWLPPG